MKKKRVVITGASGFIGSFLAESISSTYEVLAICRKEAALPRKVRQVVCDVLKDPSSLERILKKGDIVVHLACSTFPAISEINPDKDIQENVNGGNKLLKVCQEKEVGKFIFLSSGGTIYGNGLDQKKETDPLLPQNTYGRMKVMLEEFIGASGLPCLILRPSNIYGRRRIAENQMLGAIDVFLHKILQNQPIKMWGNGENIRDYLYINDLVNFIILSLKDDVCGTFNVGTGVGTSLNNIVEMIEMVTGRKAYIERLPIRDNEVRANVLDISKARNIGWKPKYNLEEGVKITLHSFL